MKQALYLAFSLKKLCLPLGYVSWKLKDFLKEWKEKEPKGNTRSFCVYKCAFWKGTIIYWPSWECNWLHIPIKTILHYNLSCSKAIPASIWFQYQWEIPTARMGSNRMKLTQLSSKCEDYPSSVPFEGTCHDQVSATWSSTCHPGHGWENWDSHQGEPCWMIQRNRVQRISDHANMEFFFFKPRGFLSAPK